MTFRDGTVAAEATVFVFRLVHFPRQTDCREKPIEAFSTLEPHYHRSTAVARLTSLVFSPDSNREKSCQPTFVHWLAPVDLGRVEEIEEEQRWPIGCQKIPSDVCSCDEKLLTLAELVITLCQTLNEMEVKGVMQ